MDRGPRIGEVLAHGADGAHEPGRPAVDNLTGFSEAIATVFPRADVQKCIVHQIRNSLKYAARQDYAALTAALRPIYQAPTAAAGAAALADFADDWGARYPTVVRCRRTGTNGRPFSGIPRGCGGPSTPRTSLKGSTGSYAR